MEVKNWAGLGPRWLVLFFGQAHKGLNADLYACVHTQLSHTRGLLLSVVSAFTRPDSSEVTTAERCSMVEDGVVRDPWVRNDVASCLWVLWLLVWDSRRKKKVISHLAFPGRFEATLLTPHTWGRGQAKRTDVLFSTQMFSACLGSECPSNQEAVRPALELWSLF